MRKITQKLLIFCFVVWLISQPLLAIADTQEAVAYLKTKNEDPWITMALAAAGESNLEIGYLRSVAGTLATDYAKTILALSAVNENPATFGNIDYVAALKNLYQNNQFGDVNLLNDDVWAILALSAVGQENSAEVQAAKNLLLVNQNADGGFSYSVGAGSDSNDTAAVIMALIEAGVSAAEPVITQAVDYLRSVQNADGGFGYQVGSVSDSGSDSWVISALLKLGINPTSWTKNSNNPITHLESLQDTDGGFWWVAPGTSDFNNKAMTAFAVIALLSKSYPVGYYQGEVSTAAEHHLRVEGVSSTICATEVAGVTALDLIRNAATICGYTYNITQESFGPYLRAINDEVASGLSGWLYFVNDTSPLVGAADYILEEDDEVLWYFGQWGWPPTRIQADQTEIDPGQSVNFKVEYFNGQEWLPLPAAKIKINNEEKFADAAGNLALTFYANGVYQAYVETADFVRSEKIQLVVGDTVSQRVGLKVVVNQGDGVIAGEAIALEVWPDQLDFGTLQPGQTNIQNLNLKNSGTVNLAIGTSVGGDSVFVSGIKIEEENYADFSARLAPLEVKAVEVSLTVPESYLASGVKIGELIFWATAE